MGGITTSGGVGSPLLRAAIHKTAGKLVQGVGRERKRAGRGRNSAWVVKGWEGGGTGKGWMLVTAIQWFPNCGSMVLVGHNPIFGGL